MKSIMTVFGTRPEAIKMAPLVKALENSHDLKSTVCVTAQHRELLDQVLGFFDIAPDYDLNVMKENQTLTNITTDVLSGVGNVIAQARPDMVLVHGDTSTSFAASLAAFYNHIPVGHVEAGLRTGDIYSPFPEEMNRTLVSRVADVHFAPTIANAKNLAREHVHGTVHITGNTVIDVLKYTIKKDYEFIDEKLRKIDLTKGRTILLTAHRRENFGQPLNNICAAMRKLVAQFDDVQVICPVHPNPTVRETIYSAFENYNRFHLIDPIEVPDMHNLMARCYLVMTDSGGLQEEAPALGKPVIVLRDVTERMEAVDAGTVIMGGICRDEIAYHASKLLSDVKCYDKMAKAANPYGDGFASERIVAGIRQYFNDRHKGERLYA